MNQHWTSHNHLNDPDRGACADLSRPEAIRRLIELGLAVKSKA